MSMLQEILEKMYIDPELLEALGEEQKQMLFIKMREEQLRRWRVNEERLEKMEAESARKPQMESNKRGVQWLTGTDGEVWVWVMGEHSTDRTIEQIIEEEEKEKARELAEKEVLMDGVLDNNDVSFTLSDASLEEQALKNQLSQMKVTPVSSGTYDNNKLRGIESVESYNPRATASYTPFASYDHIRDSSPSAEQQNGTKMTSAKSRIGPPLPVKPAKFLSSPSQSNWMASLPQTSANSESLRVSSNDVATLQNNNSYRTNMNAHVHQQPHAEPSVVQMRMNGGRNHRNNVDEEINKRQSEIFEQMQEKRERLQREAEREVERQRLAWEDQEKKAREAEAQIREIAMKAREQHRKQSLRTSTSILPALKDSNATSLRDAIKNLPRPPRPPSRKAIVEWFKKEEVPRGTGLDPRTKQPALWFHGIISRDEAENLLSNKPSGSFLVRVSERIWGYTVSYVVGDGSSKHFLIEKIADGYQFLGTNQVVHGQLYDLITYHETAPITSKGKEILKWSVGQVSAVPDHAELFELPLSNVSRYTYNSRF